MGPNISDTLYQVMAAAGYLRIATGWRDKDPANKNTQESILVKIWRGVSVHGWTARYFCAYIHLFTSGYFINNTDDFFIHLA